MANHSNTTSEFWEPDYRRIMIIIQERSIWLCTIIVFSLMSAHMYLHYAPPQYTSKLALKFDDNRSEISELLQAKNRFYRQDKIQAEKFILSSYGVRMHAAKLLNRPVSFYKKNHFNSTDLYPETPLNIEIIHHQQAFFVGLISFKTIENTYFELSAEVNGNQYRKKQQYGDVVSFPGIKFRINAVPNSPAYECHFKFNSIEAVAECLKKGLRLEEPEDDGIIHLKLRDENAQYAADALNCLAEAYLIHNKSQRSASASQTVKFIDTLLLDMQKEVDEAGKTVEEFKIKNAFLDLSIDIEHKALKLARLEAEKQQLEMQLINIQSIKDNIRQNMAVDHLNFNIQGSTDSMLATLIEQFNQKLLLKKEAGTRYKSQSEMIAKIDSEISELKLSISANIDMQIEKTLKNISYLDEQILKLKRSNRNLPAAERNFIGLKSAFDVNQKIFNYLSEKKLEALISKAAATPSAVIVDKAQPSAEVTSPNPGKVYTIATLGGFSVSLLLIFALSVLHPYIYTKETLERLSDLTIIGSVCSHTQEDGERYSVITIAYPNTPFAETIRSIRTHLTFLATKEHHKVVCITSEISGEGKSLISINLAGALSRLEKR